MAASGINQPVPEQIARPSLRQSEVEDTSVYDHLQIIAHERTHQKVLDIFSGFPTRGKVLEIPAGEGKTVVVGDKLIAVFKNGDKFEAIDDACPHMGASLSGGHLENGIVTCPWHAWRFRLKDGAWADNPRIGIGCYAVRVEGDEVQVEV